MGGLLLDKTTKDGGYEKEGWSSFWWGKEKGEKNLNLKIFNICKKAMEFRWWKYVWLGYTL